jgi:hypothetical protein
LLLFVAVRNGMQKLWVESSETRQVFGVIRGLMYTTAYETRLSWNKHAP